MKNHSEVVVDRLPNCDFPGCANVAGYDAKTTSGPWANVCDQHFRSNCYGLGLGLGQRLVLRESVAGEAVER